MAAQPVSAPRLPFSPAVRVHDMVYLSGEIGRKPGTAELVPGGMTAEARQTMDNIATTLSANGLTFADVVQCRVFLADMSKWQDFNSVYVTYFPSGKFPARSALGANGLAMGAQVEVECMAHDPHASHDKKQ
nr:RidA family protein [uncultured Sphingomonas sp.]